MQTTRRIHDHAVGIARPGGGQGVEDDGTRIGAGLVGNDLTAGALTPNLELVNRPRAERVPGGQQALSSGVPLQPGGQLGDCGGLPDAVHANDQDYREIVGGQGQRRCPAMFAHSAWVYGGAAVAAGSAARYQLLDQLRFQRIFRRSGVGDALVAYRPLQGLGQACGGHRAHVGRDQQFLQLVPEVGIEPAAIMKELADSAKQAAARRCQRLAVVGIRRLSRYVR